MRVLVATLGSIGDLMPFLAVAEALRRRGHEIICASNAGYAALVERGGFNFHAIWNGTPAPIDDLLEHAPHQAWQSVRRDLFFPAIGPTTSFINQFGRSSDCAMLASWSVLGAPAACEAMGLPLHRVCLSPYAADQAAIESPQEPNAWIGFFPEWFCASPPDLPKFLPVGFCGLDDGMMPPLEQKLENFLNQGAAPIVFTPGSYQRRSARFFQESLDACEAIGRRAVFLTPYVDQLPSRLGPDVLHLQYAPLRRLAPRSAALVHHGGIGTLSDGLRAGIPQIVTPRFFDQFDNAERLLALGVGRASAAPSYNAASLASLIQDILEDAAVGERCRQVKALFSGTSPVETVCDLVERSARR